MQRRAPRTLGQLRQAFRGLASVHASSAAPAGGVGGKTYGASTVAAAAAAGVVGGIAISSFDARLRQRALPSGYFQSCTESCCEAPLTEAQKELPTVLQGIVGAKHVRRNYKQKGSRLGEGTALAHASPGTLQEAVDLLKACIAADVAVLPQGANTSLTGGSVPRSDKCDRPTIVVSMRRLSKILPIGDGSQVLCFSGAGIFDLKELLEKLHDRDSHSVLGSLFLNPSVGAGIAYGSGGTQIRKGPAWTERALYCKVNGNGEVELVDTLGLKHGGDALSFLEGRSALSEDDLDPENKRPASWPDYGANVRTLDGKVARFNADTTGIDCCRSEGKVMILASIHDSYPQPKRSELLWVSCRDFDTVHALKREVALRSPTCMARSCEYMNRETVQGVDAAGRILIKMIELVGMKNLEPLWNIKLMVEATGLPFSTVICDKFLWWFNGIIPRPLPQSMASLCEEFDHHCLVEFSEYSEGEVDRLRSSLDAFVAALPEGHVKYHVCGDGFEKTRATLFRFVVAPAFRTFAVGKGMQGLSIDYALPKSYRGYPALPEEQYPIASRWVYSHFGCNVYHEDLVFDNSINVEKAKYEIKHAVEHTGGRLPAEHGHGTEYKAPKEMQERWKKMDPMNIMNPGVGGLSNNKNYSSSPVHLGGCCSH